MKSGNFFDIRHLVSAGGERGLLGLAFHPKFGANGLVFAFFTRTDGDIVVARFATNVLHTDVIESSYAPLMVIEHSGSSNHDGGDLAFGPHDGYLYIATGDGGGTGDPANNAQNITRTLLGKILRVNADGTGGGSYGRYAIPASNPFGPGVTGRDEIWSYGLRNPWRISFDRSSRDLFAADVGQAAWGEINREAHDLTWRPHLWLERDGRSSLLQRELVLTRRRYAAGGRIRSWHRQLLHHRRPRLSWAQSAALGRTLCVRRLLQRPHLDDAADRNQREHGPARGHDRADHRLW